jgi:hypothetical protein
MRLSLPQPMTVITNERITSGYLMSHLRSENSCIMLAYAELRCKKGDSYERADWQ